MVVNIECITWIPRVNIVKEQDGFKDKVEALEWSDGNVDKFVFIRYYHDRGRIDYEDYRWIDGVLYQWCGDHREEIGTWE